MSNALIFLNHPNQMEYIVSYLNTIHTYTISGILNKDLFSDEYEKKRRSINIFHSFVEFTEHNHKPFSTIFVSALDTLIEFKKVS